MKLKQKASNRLRRRYLLVKSGSRDLIEKTILDYIGLLGWAKSSPSFVENSLTGKGKYILAIERKMLNDIRASFEMSKEKLSILGVSGTLKGLEKFDRNV